VDRLVDFMAAHDPILADEIEQELSQAPKRLLDFPRRGSRLSEFESREVREFRVGSYLLRYELAGTDIFVLRFFHAREDRF
jgi:plasmid stabilization system protein ParE